MKGIGGLCKKLEIPVFPPKWPRSGVTYYFKLFVKTFFHNFLSQPQREFNASAQNSFPKPELTGSGSACTSPWPCLLLAPASPKIPFRWSPIQIQPPYFRTQGSPAWQIPAPLSKLFLQVDQKYFPVNKTHLIYPSRWKGRTFSMWYAVCPRGLSHPYSSYTLVMQCAFSASLYHVQTF